MRSIGFVVLAFVFAGCANDSSPVAAVVSKDDPAGFIFGDSDPALPELPAFLVSPERPLIFGLEDNPDSVPRHVSLVRCSEGRCERLLSSENGWIGHAACSPTNGQVAFLANYRDVDGNEVFNDLFVFDPPSGALRNLTNDAVPQSHLSWSSDGKSIVFDSISTNGDGKVIEIIDVENGRRRQLPTNVKGPSDPDWSPKESTIVFVARASIENLPSDESAPVIFEGDEIYLIGSDGSDRRKLLNKGSCLSLPRWSRDGRRICFSRSFVLDRIGDYEIWSMAGDGSDLRQHTQLGGMNLGGHFVPDGKSIVFYHYEEGGDHPAMNLFSVDLSEGTVTQLTDVNQRQLSFPVFE